MQSAFHALLKNVYCYSPDGGSLKVDLHIEDGKAVVSITDPGVGISEKDRPKVFKPFYRGLHKDSQGNYIDVRGIGMGLYMAKMVAELHHGDLEITHTGVGKGSTFTLYLPLLT